MKTKKIKTVDVIAKEWFDKVNGNSYCAGTVTVNFGMPDEREYKFPFQYGYGSYYEQAALSVLKEAGEVPEDASTLWGWCDDNGVILRSNKEENCLKRQLKAV